MAISYSQYRRIGDALQLVYKSVISVYTLSQDNFLNFVGSAVAVSIGRHKMIFSASHVLKHIQSGGLYAYTGHNFQEIRGKVLFSETDEDPTQDYGFIDFDHETKEIFVNIDFLGLESIQVNHVAVRDPLYMTIGYPESRVKIRPGNVSMKRNVSLCEPATDYEYIENHVKKELFLLYHYKKTVFDKRQNKLTSPFPTGMSGGAVFYMENGLDLKADVQPRLVGINIQFKIYKKSYLIWAVRIGLITSLLRNVFNDLRSILPVTIGVNVHT